MSRDSAVLVVLVVALVAIGLVALYSATGVGAERSARYPDGTYFLRRQLVWVALSAAALGAGALVPLSVWRRGGPVALALTVGLLVLVFVPGVGAQINAARRWVRLGGWVFQPSEAAKLGIAVFLCGFAASDPDRLRRFWTGFLPAGAALGLVCGLILVEPDVGTALFVGLVGALVLLVAGLRPAHALPAFLAGAGLLAYYALGHTEHVLARVQTFLHPDRDPLGKGHQILQSLVALGSGGWTGVGLGRGMSKLYYLPEVHSDFIFPVIGEEMGFLGAAGVLLLYAALGAAGYRIAWRARDRFGFLLAFALTGYIILQAILNVAVATGSVPTKGIPLPFVSAGGSSLLVAAAEIGILVRIARESEGGECGERAGGSSSPEAAPAAMSSRA